MIYLVKLILEKLSEDIQTQNIELYKEIVEEKIKWIKSKDYLSLSPVQLNYEERQQRLKDYRLKNQQ